MEQRLDYYAIAPELVKPMLVMERALNASGLEHGLIELVKLRASQINGCAYCIHMHSHALRRIGETEDRMQLLNAWRESSLYSAREQVALAWCEALTRIDQGHADDTVYVRLDGYFTQHEMVALTLVITTINAWNRLAIGFRVAHPGPDTATAA